MTVLRESRDSLVAMLEAFLYDPLISWRLVDLSNKDGVTGKVGHTDNVAGTQKNEALDVDAGVPIDPSSRSGVLPISEGDEEDDDENGDMVLPDRHNDPIPSVPARKSREVALSATRARSLQMYTNIQTWAANLGADGRIASIAGADGKGQVAASSSIARSRIAERSIRQRELLSLLEGEHGRAAEEALNTKALKVIRRVQDKLAGTDFEDRAENGDPLDVTDQVQRLIVQATSIENLSQLYVGWCAFW
jgi:phosphatidylinositol kinase/protein kinase (PI-3  family)